MAFIIVVISGLNQSGRNYFLPAGLIHGLNRFKPAGGFYLPTLVQGIKRGASDAPIIADTLG